MKITSVLLAAAISFGSVAQAATIASSVVRNTDPIDHELIVGRIDVHRRHRYGTEPWHATRPGEVSVPLFATRATTYTFRSAGTYWFGCHLPGHWDYGMRGRIVVS
jgi:uncharacterized cupredoxin-like copper-binding protein